MHPLLAFAYATRIPFAALYKKAVTHIAFERRCHEEGSSAESHDINETVEYRNIRFMNLDP